MKGLLIKEFYLLEGQIKSWLLVMGLMFFYACFAGGNSFLYMLVILIGVMSTLTVFSLDRACGWDSFVTSLPLTRKEIVASRYLFAFLIDIGISVLSLVLVVLHFIMRVEEPLTDSLHSLALMLIITLLMQIILLPTVYKWGVEKARFVYMACFLILSAVIFFITQTGRSSSLALIVTGLSLEQIMYAAQAAALLFVLLGGLLSFTLSVKIYEKKEF